MPRVQPYLTAGGEVNAGGRFSTFFAGPRRADGRVARTLLRVETGHVQTLSPAYYVAICAVLRAATTA
jgi:hypothetical protein